MFSPSAVEQLRHLQSELQDGEITQKGLYKRLQKIFLEHHVPLDPASVNLQELLEQVDRDTGINETGENSFSDNSVESLGLSSSPIKYTTESPIQSHYSASSGQAFQIQYFRPPHFTSSTGYAPYVPFPQRPVYPYPYYSYPQHQIHPEMSQQFSQMQVQSIENDYSLLDNPLGQTFPVTSSLPFPKGLYDEKNSVLLDEFQSIADILRYRAHVTPKSIAFTTYDHKGKETGSISFAKLHGRAEKIARSIKEKKSLKPNDQIGLLYSNLEAIDFIVALFGCLYAEMIAVPIATCSQSTEDELSEILFILENNRLSLALTTESTFKYLNKEFIAVQGAPPPRIDWWKTNDMGSYHPKKSAQEPPSASTSVSDHPAYVEYTKNVNGELKAIVMTHDLLVNQCYILKSMFQATSDDKLLSALEFRQQLGFIMGVFFGIFNGHQTVFMSDSACAIPGYWLSLANKSNATLALLNYPLIHEIIQTSKDFRSKSALQLGSLRHLFFETLRPDMKVHAYVLDILSPFGLGSQTLVSLCSLYEFGGICIGYSSTSKESTLLIDRLEIKRRKVQPPKERLYQDSIDAVREFLPELAAAIVDPDDRTLVPPNVVGEIWISSDDLLPKFFWSLPKLSAKTFHAYPILLQKNASGLNEFNSIPLMKRRFMRTGLVGFFDNDQHLFILGTLKEMIFQHNFSANQEAIRWQSRGLTHFTSHLMTTLLQIFPEVICGTLFNVSIQEQQLPVLLVEACCPKESYIKLEKAILQCLFDLHQLKIYCVMICKNLPRMKSEQRMGLLRSSATGFFEGIFELRSSINGSWKRFISIDAELAKSMFLAGRLDSLHAHLHMGPEIFCWRDMYLQSSPPNMEFMAKMRQLAGGISSTAPEMLDDLMGMKLLEFKSITELLIWRSEKLPELTAYSVFDFRARETKIITFKKLSWKIYGLAHFLSTKNGIVAGDRVIVLIPHGIDYILTIHALFYLGAIPVPLPPIDLSRTLEDMSLYSSIAKTLSVKCTIVNQMVEDFFKSRPIQKLFSKGDELNDLSPALFQLLNVSKAPKSVKGLSLEDPLYVRAEDTAILLVHIRGQQSYAISEMTHQNMMSQCRIQTLHHQLLNSVGSSNLSGTESNLKRQGTEVSLYALAKNIPNSSQRPLCSPMKPFHGLGFLFSIVLGVFLGSPTIVLPPYDFNSSPISLFDIIQKNRVRDVAIYPSILDQAMACFSEADQKVFSLHNVKNFILPFQDRCDPNYCLDVFKKFSGQRLDSSAISPALECPLNPMLSCHGSMLTELTTVFLDKASLRRGKVCILHEVRGIGRMASEMRADCLLVTDCGKVAPDTLVAIVKDEQLCSADELGEIWISSSANAGKCSELIGESVNVHTESSSVSGVDPNYRFAPTGLLGFLYPVPMHALDPLEGNDGRRASIVNRGWRDLVYAGLPHELLLFVVGKVQESFVHNGLRYFAKDIEQTIVTSHDCISDNSCVVFKASEHHVVCILEILHPTEMYNAAPRIVNRVLEQHEFIIGSLFICHPNTLPKSRSGHIERQQVIEQYFSKQLDIVEVLNIL